ncbi:hypothetical protein Tco_0089142 [Tanacetum coccineum]
MLIPLRNPNVLWMRVLQWLNVMSLSAGFIVIKTLIITAIGPCAGLTLQESLRIGVISMTRGVKPERHERIIDLTVEIEGDIGTLEEDLDKFTLRVPNQEFVEPLPHDALISFIEQLGYKGALELVSEMYTDHMYQPWRTFFSIINSSRLTTCKQVLKEESICLNPDSPRSSSITYSQNTAHYLKDTARSLTQSSHGKGVTGKKKAETVVPKEKKKATTPKKKSSITTDDKILPDPYEALKLGESMSLTEAEIEEEERCVHETHASIVIGKEENLEAKEVANTVESEET